MNETNGEKRFRFTRQQFRRAAFCLFAAGTTGIAAFIVALILDVWLQVSDARCWQFQPDCGGPLLPRVVFVLHASPIVAGVGVVGAAVLFGLSFVAPLGQPTDAEHTAPEARRG